MRFLRDYLKEKTKLKKISNHGKRKYLGGGKLPFFFKLVDNLRTPAPFF